MGTLFFVVGYSILFFAVVVALIFVRARARQDRAPFPENTRLLRGPGESLQRKLVKLGEQLESAIALGLAVPVAVLALGFLFATKLGSGTGILIGTALAVIAFAALLVQQARRVVALLDRQRNTALGLFGERIVAEHLEPLKAMGYRVLHDVPAGEPEAGSTVAPFNLDHVVVGPSGVFAIETKTRRKGRARVGFMAHEIIYDGRALAYPWGEDQYGLEQAQRQAEWLATFLQKQLGQPIPVQALLVFPGWMIIRKGRGAVNVLNPKELPAAIVPTAGTAVPALAPALADLVARQLEARCRDVEL
jgi:Nuclease-related domain